MIAAQSQLKETVLNLDFTAKAQNTKLIPQLNLSDSPPTGFCLVFILAEKQLQLLCLKFGSVFPVRLLLLPKSLEQGITFGLA